MNRLQDRIATRKNKEVYDLIRKQGIVSKIDLLEQSKMTGSTLTRTLEELTSQNLIVEAGLGESTGGRRPILYQTNPAYAYVLGLEISRITSKLVLCDLHMNKLESKKWQMTETMTPEQLFGEITLAIRSMMVRRGISEKDMLGLGIGAVGPLDRVQGTILEPLYFPAQGWNQVEVTKYFEQRFDFPILLDNGANAAILGEYWAEHHLETKHLLYIHAAVGLRSSMMTGGKLVYGAVDMEGSIGQMVIQSDGKRLSSTSNYGSLEAYASIQAIELEAQAKLKQGRRSSLLDLEPHAEKIRFGHIVQALADNDPLTVEIMTQAATYFGIGLSNLLNILHPEKVILGGTLISSHPLFFQVSTEVALRNTYYYPTYQVEFSQGILGEEALVTGAAVMVLNQLTE
ncbi:ROK family protein [Paenibacillus thalictri]|uniref:ROK family protein n=1 Tax=Paenibacillus thalictri TaxID=2527873 RepID=A0A4Q9E0M9_9BACL|nr:ROK family protein [Paenibacillus thalictri]TBL81693.1 ROK family protein [Paenibacillus thalictri]